MNALGYAAWQEHRELYRQEFYGDPSASTADAPGLDTLAQITDLRKHNNSYEDGAISDSVHTIIQEHEETVLSGGEGLYAMRDPASVSAIAGLTAKVITYWNRTCRQHARATPFEGLTTLDTIDLSQPLSQKVIELGAVVLETVQRGMPYNPATANKVKQGYLAAYIARHNPSYTDRWLTGDAIREYCEAHDIDYHDALKRIPPGRLAQFALEHSASPEKRVAQAIRWFNELTPEVIAASTGWDNEEVAETFTPARLMRMCSTGAVSPLERIKDIVKKTNEDGNAAALAQRLGWDEQRTAHVFTRKFIIKVAIERSDAYRQIEQIAQHLDGDLSLPSIAAELDLQPYEVADMFTPRTLRDIAHGHKAPLRKIKQAVQDLHGVYSEENIALHLGAPLHKVRSVFTRTLRIDLALRYRAANDADRYKRPRDILRVLRFLETDFGITGRIAVSLARFKSPETARKRAQLIVDELPLKPDNVSVIRWMNVVADMPNATHQQRLDRLQRLQSWFNIVHSVAVDDMTTVQARNYESHAHGMMPVPNDTNPSDNLLALGKAAGIADQDMRQLLKFFANSLDCELEDDQAAALVERLRAQGEGR